MTELMVAEWLLDKKSDEAKRYQMWFDMGRRNENGTPFRENGKVSCNVIVIKETEKAMYVEIPTGLYGGVSTGFKTWLPKSQVTVVA